MLLLILLQINFALVLAGNVVEIKCTKHDCDVINVSITKDTTVRCQPNNVTKYIDIRKSDLSHIPKEIFDNHKILETINLNHQKIRKILKGTFENAETLEKLWLIYNLINELQDDSFAGAYNLTEIFLDRNKIQTITTNTFRGLSKLKNLTLTKNAIKVLPSKVFFHLYVVRSINLSLNPIEEVGEASFPRQEKLMQVDLTKNDCFGIIFEYSGGIPVADLIANYLKLNNCSLKAVTDKQGLFEGGHVIYIALGALSVGVISTIGLVIGSKLLSKPVENQPARNESGPYSTLSVKIDGPSQVHDMNEAPYLMMKKDLVGKNKIHYELESVTPVLRIKN